MKFSNSNGYYIFIFLFTITFIVVGIININNYNKIIQDKSEEAHGFSKNTVILFKWLTLGIVILCGIILFFNLFSFSFGIGFFEWMSPNASFLSKEVEGIDVADYLYRAGSPIAAKINAAGEKLKPVGSGLYTAGSATASGLGKVGSAAGSGLGRAGKSATSAFGSLIGTGDLGNINLEDSPDTNNIVKKDSPLKLSPKKKLYEDDGIELTNLSSSNFRLGENGNISRDSKLKPEEYPNCKNDFDTFNECENYYKGSIAEIDKSIYYASQGLKNLRNNINSDYYEKEARIKKIKELENDISNMEIKRKKLNNCNPVCARL